MANARKDRKHQKKKKRWLSRLVRMKLAKDLVRLNYRGIRPVTVADLLGCKVPKRPNIMGGFLKKGGRCLIAGPAGVGKTHLGLAIAAHISMGKSLLGWNVERPWRVVYLDGEMAPAQVVSRVKRWARRLPNLLKDDNFRVAPFTATRSRPVDVATEEGQRVIEASIGEDAEVVVIDNYAAFNPNGREDAEAWAPVDAFLNKLSRKGVATILIHHSGKGRSAKYRGSSRLVGPVDTFIALSRLDGVSATGSAHFAMRFEKTRDRATGDVTPREVRLKCFRRRGYKLIATPLDDPAAREAQIQLLIEKGLTNGKIAKKLGVNRSTVHRHRKRGLAK